MLLWATNFPTWLQQRHVVPHCPCFHLTCYEHRCAVVAQAVLLVDERPASTARDQHSSSSTGFGQPRVARQEMVEMELRARAAFTPVTVTVRNEVKLWGTKAPPTQQPAPRRGPHAHERPRTQTQADATDRAASTERPHQHTTQSAPRAVRWCRRAGPFETDTRARAGLSVPAPSPSVPHAPQPPSLMVRESAQK